MKKLAIGLVALLILSAVAVSASGGLVDKTLPINKHTSSGSSGGGNSVGWYAIHKNRGTPGCYDPFRHRSIPAGSFDGQKPSLSQAFLDCSKLYASEPENKNRDFGNAIAHWKSYKLKTYSGGFNPEVATYHYQLEQALNRAWFL